MRQFVLVVDQPNYIPWKGYFDLIHDADLFVFYTDVQYTTRDWRNRNKIVTANGLKWLSVPVGSDIHRLVHEVRIGDCAWQKKHYEALRLSYAKTPHFKDYKDFLEDAYLGRTWHFLHELDRYMTEAIARNFLGCKTEFADSREFCANGAKHERMLSLVKNVFARKHINNLSNDGGGYTFRVLRRRTISSPKITRMRESALHGNAMMAIPNILRGHLCRLRILSPSLTSCSMWEKMPLIISGAGGKRQERRLGLWLKHDGYLSCCTAEAAA